MPLFEHVILFIISVVMITGGYQFYFFAQNHPIRKARCFLTRFDAWISYDPRWVWAYAFLYYPMILSITFSMDSWRQFGFAISNFLLLLACQFAFFMLIPVGTPVEWRQNKWKGISQKILDTMQSIDKRTNCFPSMHVSMATMTELYLTQAFPWLFPYGILFPIIIAISALKTKQHFVTDVIPGAILGFLVFTFWQMVVMTHLY